MLSDSVRGESLRAGATIPGFALAACFRALGLDFEDFFTRLASEDAWRAQLKQMHKHADTRFCCGQKIALSRVFCALRNGSIVQLLRSALQAKMHTRKVTWL
jgi:hypothetical protein